MHLTVFSHLACPLLVTTKKERFLSCSLVVAPTQPWPNTQPSSGNTVEGKQAGRITQISTVSQMIHFCTCFPDTH